MTTRQAQKKRQLRRSVSLSPRAFLALKALSTEGDEPMAPLVERLTFAEAERRGVEVLTDEKARANMTAEWHKDDDKHDGLSSRCRCCNATRSHRHGGKKL